MKIAARLADPHAVVDDADEQPAEDVDQRDHDAGNGVAADEFAGTVHSPEEVGLPGDFLASSLGFALVDDSRVQIGVDRHLPPGHAVQGETRGDFTDARGAFGDHHELNHHDNDEDDQPDHDIVAGNELAEGADHFAGGFEFRGASVGEDEPRGGHVEHQPEKRGGQEQRREKC